MKKLPIGISEDVLLIPGLRRFGQTLNLSMLKYFYSANIYPAIGQTEPDSEHLFTHLHVWKVGKEYTGRRATQSAIRQIQKKIYETKLIDLGMNCIHKLAIVFEGKDVKVTEC